MNRLAVCLALALTLPAISAADDEPAAKRVSAVQVLRRALVPQRKALEACGVRWEGAPKRAIARFGLDFEGRVRGLKIELVGMETVRACLAKSLAELRVPARLAYVVREVALPLPVVEPTAN